MHGGLRPAHHEFKNVALLKRERGTRPQEFETGDNVASAPASRGVWSFDTGSEGFRANENSSRHALK
jgi:hypothetical protein